MHFAGATEKELTIIHFTSEMLSLVKRPLVSGINQEHCIYGSFFGTFKFLL